MLPCDHHTMAPCYEGGLCRLAAATKWPNGLGVAGLGCGSGLRVYLYRQAVHAGQLLVGAGVERQGTVSSRSQALIFSLFSGEYGNGSSDGHGRGA